MPLTVPFHGRAAMMCAPVVVGTKVKDQGSVTSDFMKTPSLENETLVVGPSATAVIVVVVPKTNVEPSTKGMPVSCTTKFVIVKPYACVAYISRSISINFFIM